MSNQTPDGDQFDGFAPRDQGFSLLRTPSQTLRWYLRAAPFDLRPRDDAQPRRSTTKAGPAATRPVVRNREGKTLALLRGLLLAGLAVLTVGVLLLGLLLAGLAVLTVGTELSSLTSGHGVVQLRPSGYFEPFLHMRAPGVGWHQNVGSYWRYWTCIAVTLLVAISVVRALMSRIRRRQLRARRRRAAHSLSRTAMVLTRDREIEQAKARFEESMSAPKRGRS